MSSIKRRIKKLEKQTASPETQIPEIIIVGVKRNEAGELVEVSRTQLKLGAQLRKLSTGQ